MGLLTPINTNIITGLINYLKNTVITINIATQAEAESAASGVLASIDNTKIITPKGWRYAWNKALTLVWTFTNKINFGAAVNVATTSGNPPSVTTQGDVYYSNAGLLGAGYYGATEGIVGDTRFITSNNASSESALGIIQIATQAEVDAGTIDTKSITPLKLKNKVLNTSNAASGTTSATLNAINGIISYSTGANPSTLSYYTLTNSKISASSYVVPTIKVNSAEPAVLLLGGYSISGTQITFYVYNASGSTSGSFKIHFQIAG